MLRGGRVRRGVALDTLGDHAAACTRSGLLALGAPLLEQAWARVVREGLGVLANTTARDVAQRDKRRLELFLFFFSGAPLVCPRRRDGHAQPHAAGEDGAAVIGAQRCKEAR